MSLGLRHITALRAMVLVCIALSALLPASAGAAPTDAQIERKKEEREQATDELDVKRAELAQQVNEYIGLTRDIKRLEAEVSEVSSDVAQADAKLTRRKGILNDRANQLYRGDHASIITLLLTAQDFDDFLNRAYFMTLIGERDAQLVDEVTDARVESLWLQERLSMRLDRLEQLVLDADRKLEKIEAEVEEQETKTAALGQDLANMLREQAAAAAAAAAAASQRGAEPGTDFDPDTIISQSAFRDADSMSAEQIQSFLERQPGRLASYRTKDYKGRDASAAEMIAEAAQAWDINPKVLLVKLQKEQSLLADRTPSQRALDWALGVGKTDGGTIGKYQGFGNQIWYGAKSLNNSTKPWSPGITRTIDGSTVKPTNSATFALYRYTPHLRGNMSFWLLYWRYFGDPLAEV